MTKKIVITAIFPAERIIDKFDFSSVQFQLSVTNVFSFLQVLMKITTEKKEHEFEKPQKKHITLDYLTGQ